MCMCMYQASFVFENIFNKHKKLPKRKVSLGQNNIAYSNSSLYQNRRND